MFIRKNLRSAALEMIAKPHQPEHNQHQGPEIP